MAGMDKVLPPSRKRMASAALVALGALLLALGVVAAPIVRCVSAEEDRLMLREYRLLPERARNSAIVVCVDRYPDLAG